MELRQLRCFVRTAEYLNFTRAAESLSIAQPALSRHIQSLEAELGFPLFERNSRRVELTKEGSVFREDISEILELLEAAESRVKRFHQKDSLLLTMGFAPYLGGELIYRLVKELKAQDSRIHLQLKDMTNLEMIAGIREEALDLALLPLISVPKNSNFVKIPLVEDSLQIALSLDNKLSSKESISLADLASESLLAYSKRDYPDYYLLLDEVFQKAGFSLQVAQAFDAGSSLLASVQSGAGVALIPPSFSGLPANVITRPIKGVHVAVKSGILYNRRKPEEFITTICKACMNVAQVAVI